MRRLGILHEVTVASPDYLARYGTPRKPEELDGHFMVGFLSSLTGEVLPLEFTIDASVREVRLPMHVSANHSDTTADLARRGFGLAQAPRYRFAAELAEGNLVEILPDYPPTPTSIFALYPQNRELAPRLRVFLDLIATVFRQAAI
jgi:DNA-binding transcriptional LysR family regulator